MTTTTTMNLGISFVVIGFLWSMAVNGALAVPVEQTVEKTNGWNVPQKDGSSKWMTEDDRQNILALNARSEVPVYYYLYTNESPDTPEEIIAEDASSLSSSSYNQANPTRIIIHGWRDNYLSAVNVLLRGALLATGTYNVICVDWSAAADTLDYPYSVAHVPGVGVQVANFIDFVYEQGYLSFDTLWVMGHSLGAHVSGFAGKNVQYGQINQITGLDPAAPLFPYDKPADRLNENDAAYVESIQTCGGLLGFLEPIGKGAFYPNGGRYQPGCGIDLDGACRHERSYIYYAEAIRENNFPTVQCGNYEDANEQLCGSTFSSVLMGAPTNYENAFGDYFVPVNSQAPYGTGA